MVAALRSRVVVDGRRWVLELDSVVGEPSPVGRLIDHLLSQFDYEDATPDRVELPVMRDMPYVRPPMTEQTFVPWLL